MVGWRLLEEQLDGIGETGDRTDYWDVWSSFCSRISGRGRFRIEVGFDKS